MLKLAFSKKVSSPKLDVFLNDLEFLTKFDEIEVSVTYYALKRGVKADDFHFDPYEDYVYDLAEGKRSTYQSVVSGGPQLFGVALGGIILCYFGFFFPWLLLSVESIVAIFGAYTFGKEVWMDVDSFLQNLSSNSSLKWTQQDFYYSLQQFGTMQRFWQLARQKRYGYQLTLPRKLDFISHSNSKTVEMQFKTSDLVSITTDKVRVLSINFPLIKKADLLPSAGLVIGKVTGVKKFLGINYRTEWYQSFDGKSIGALDTQNKWLNQKSFQKTLLSFGRLMWTMKTKLISQKIIEV